MIIIAITPVVLLNIPVGGNMGKYTDMSSTTSSGQDITNSKIPTPTGTGTGISVQKVPVKEIPHSNIDYTKETEESLQKKLTERMKSMNQQNQVRDSMGQAQNMSNQITEEFARDISKQ